MAMDSEYHRHSCDYADCVILRVRYCVCIVPLFLSKRLDGVLIVAEHPV